MADPNAPNSTVLFTAFEPSGDDHASTVIAELKRRHPDLRIVAWGGPKMEAAGAEVIERTGDDAVMGMPGLSKILQQRQTNQRIGEWIAKNPPAVHVPVDSPAANFPVCALSKKHGVTVVHLVAPQLWAWAPWRIRKLRRRTDHVLCVLPFEEDWFTTRGVSAEFVGHPIFDCPLDTDALDREVGAWPGGNPRIAIMPGSRPSEITKNFPLFLETYRRLAREHAGIAGVVAAARPEIEAELREIAGATGGWPDSLQIVVGNTDAVIRWCDLALVVSGTVTLQIARQQRPMVIAYKAGRLFWSFARWLVQTKFFALPNVIAGKEIVPELVPHFGGPDPIADRAIVLLEDPDASAAQRTALGKLAAQFTDRSAATRAADAIEQRLGLSSTA